MHRRRAGLRSIKSTNRSDTDRSAGVQQHIPCNSYNYNLASLPVPPTAALPATQMSDPHTCSKASSTLLAYSIPMSCCTLSGRPECTSLRFLCGRMTLFGQHTHSALLSTPVLLLDHSLGDAGAVCSEYFLLNPSHWQYRTSQCDFTSYSHISPHGPTSQQTDKGKNHPDTGTGSVFLHRPSGEMQLFVRRRYINEVGRLT
jgi:hypothetical protein